MLDRLVLGAMLLLPAIIVFAPGLDYPFCAIDDVHFVVHNPAIRDLSWGGIRYLFTEDTRDLRYFPVSYLSLAVDHRLFGLDPFYFRLTNLVWHLVNTVLVASVIGRTFRDRTLGFWTALLFSIHPLQVESVVWIMSRKNMVFLFFFLVAALAYLEAVERRDGGRPGARWLLFGSALSYLVACLAKTAALPLPVTLLFVDLVRDRDAVRRPLAFLKRRLPSKLVYFLPAVLVLAAMRAYDAPNPFQTDYGFGVVEWILIVGHNFLFYLEKTLWPFGLAPFVPLPPAGGIPTHFAVYTVLVVGLVVATVWSLWRGWSLVFFGLAWYLVTIAPNTVYALVFSDLPLLVADRYFYLSAIGVLLLPAAGGLWLWRSRPRWRGPLAAASAGVLCAWVVVASLHRSHWASTRALYHNVLEHHPNDEFYFRLALEEEAAGRMDAAFQALDDAERAPAKTFFLDFLYYRLELTRLYLAKREFSAAADQFEFAIAATPNAYEPFDAGTRLAFLYLADLRERAGDEAGRRRALEAAARAPRDLSPEFELAWIRALPDEARRFLEARLEAHPEDGRAWLASGILAQAGGDERGARERLERARELGQGSELRDGRRGP